MEIQFCPDASSRASETLSSPIHPLLFLDSIGPPALPGAEVPGLCRNSEQGVLRSAGWRGGGELMLGGI